MSNASVLADLNARKATVIGIPSSPFISDTKVATFTAINATELSLGRSNPVRKRSSLREVCWNERTTVPRPESRTGMIGRGRAQRWAPLSTREYIHTGAIGVAGDVKGCRGSFLCPPLIVIARRAATQQSRLLRRLFCCMTAGATSCENAVRNRRAAGEIDVGAEAHSVTTCSVQAVD